MQIKAIAQTVLDASLAQIVGRGLTAPARVLLAPGETVVWDDCCDGQLWIRVLTIAPLTGTAGVQRARGPDPRCHITGWTIRLGIGYVGCSVAFDEYGNIPAPDTLTAETVSLLDYADAIRAAIMCDLPVEFRPRPVEWRGLGPEGGCSGGEWTVDVEQGP